ncbi:HDOD domain-containing protein [Colwellia sp. 1_MG-2023]|uniref:HDOD domain-containing protein n=1 Tax=Colwellia sp. 1_MG-2023 TaxID=3062649 RepID=UPI0026E403B9|nr:HDOD domain-containing protein [Colwellia sp. 1_MG-2023]MDO6445313.1 HDOD domain-containing protein [Colwellia sp. 1_MG-2023]
MFKTQDIHVKGLATEVLNTDFYDVMFGSIDTNGAMSALEQNTLSQITKVLTNPAQLNKHIPALPAMLVKLLDTLKDPHADFDTFVDIIEQDPAFAAEVLKVANTAKYNRTNKEIIYLSKATSLLGISGLMKIASTLLMADVIPCNPLYYQLYGRLIWVHSVQCATLCELLAIHEKQNTADAYFLGLIHDLGRIIVFNCISHDMKKTFASLTPCTREYKILMTEMSRDITYFIAKEWQLPSIYVEALKEQREGTRNPLSDLLFKANCLSENYLLFNKKSVTEDEYQSLQKSLGIDEKIFEEFNELAPAISESII